MSYKSPSAGFFAFLRFEESESRRIFDCRIGTFSVVWIPFFVTKDTVMPRRLTPMTDDNRTTNRNSLSARWATFASIVLDPWVVVCLLATMTLLVLSVLVPELVYVCQRSLQDTQQIFGHLP